MSTPAQELQRQLTVFVRTFGLHQPDRTACGQPISTSEAHALGVIHEQAPLRMTALADELVLDKSTVTRLVGSMAERGWVRVTADRADRRARLVALTASGRRAAERLQSARVAHFESVLDAIEPRRRTAVVDALAELTRAARAAREGELDASVA